MIVLDTHAWLWWLSGPERLGKRATRAIDKADRLGVPAISVWEVAMKVQTGRLRLNQPVATWVEQGLAVDPRLELLPLLPSISVESAALSWDHRDPADRLIVATARVYESSLVTADERIRASGLVRCIWD